MRVYYAHCKAIYNTPQEERDVMMLEALGFEVINPSAHEHQIGCVERAQQGGTEMGYFEDLVKSCYALAFRALPTHEIPAGVFKEVNCALRFNMPVIELPSRISVRGIDVEETREYLREVGER